MQWTAMPCRLVRMAAWNSGCVRLALTCGRPTRPLPLSWPCNSCSSALVSSAFADDFWNPLSTAASSSMYCTNFYCMLFWILVCSRVGYTGPLIKAPLLRAGVPRFCWQLLTENLRLMRRKKPNMTFHVHACSPLEGQMMLSMLSISSLLIER